MSQLPHGWSVVKLRDLSLTINYGHTASATAQRVGPRFLRITDIQDDQVDWSSVPFCACDDPEKYNLSAGDIVVARTGATTGKSYLIKTIPESAVFASYLIRIQPNAAVQPPYLSWFMQSPSYWEQITTVSKGTAQPGANASLLGELDVPLAPGGAQRRIVSKIESLTARSRRAKEALDEIPTLLERFRQSVLAAAFRGDLTAGWREKNPDVEPADVLLKRIRIERRKRWEEAELAKMRVKGKVPGDDRWKAKYEEPAPVDTSELPELPEGWVWARIGLVAPLQAGYAFPSSGFRSSGVRLLKGVNVRDGWLAVDDLDYWNPADVAQFEQFQLKTGDIVLAMDRPVYSSGSKATKVVELDASWNGALLLQRVGRFQSVSLLLRKYLYLFVSSHFFRRHIIEEQNGTQDGKDLPHVSAGMVDAAIIPVPPLEEQAAIVASTNEALATHNRVRAAVGDCLNLVRTIDSSILSKAFRGELVPQDPNDEPASVLLERIRAEAAKQEGTTKKRAGKKRAVNA